jgi:methionyl-tRNA synthetase
MANIIVTITPPTPNGDLHIGHLSGPFLGADVFARAQRQRGHNCVLVSYSDDYESYMLRRGRELDRDPVELARENTEKMTGSLKLAGIEIDHWMSPYGNHHYRDAVREIFSSAAEDGAIEFRDSAEPYCPSCDVWGYEAFGRGNCNHCGADSDASQCEHCANTPDAKKMRNFRCKLCGSAHTWPIVNRAFLRISPFADRLKTVFAETPLRTSTRAWIQQALSASLEDWGVTRPQDGGLDLEPDGSCRVQTWFMSLAGYIASFREFFSDDVNKDAIFAKYWKTDGSILANFMGYDCLYSHAIAMPALLMTMPGYKVKQRFYANQFLTLNGENLSTSRNYAIWIRDLVAEACPDSVRLYLASVAPEDSTSDFNIEVFRKWRTETFINQYDALIDAAARKASEHWLDGLDSDEKVYVLSARARWFNATSLDRFSIRALAQLVLDLLTLSYDRLEKQRSFKHLLVLAAIFGEPLHPALSARILHSCEIDRDAALADVMTGSAAEYSI